jgi:co-chaperonin GroES (HSP10)
VPQAPALPAGLIAPDAWVDATPTTGVIVGVGVGFSHPGFADPQELVGVPVLFSTVAGQDVVFDGEAFIVLTADELLAFFDEEG